MGSLSFKKSMRWRPDAGELLSKAWAKGGCWQAHRSGYPATLPLLVHTMHPGLRRLLTRVPALACSLFPAHAVAAGAARRDGAALHLRRPASRCVGQQLQARHRQTSGLQSRAACPACNCQPKRPCAARLHLFRRQQPHVVACQQQTLKYGCSFASAGDSTRLLRNADAPEQRVAGADAYQSVLQQGRIRWGCVWVRGPRVCAGVVTASMHAHCQWSAHTGAPP